MPEDRGLQIREGQFAIAYLIGDAPESKTFLLTLWKDADPDIPIYKQAKVKYAKLQQRPSISLATVGLALSATHYQS